MLWPHTKAEDRIQNTEDRTIFKSDPSTVLGAGF